MRKLLSRHCLFNWAVEAFFFVWFVGAFFFLLYIEVFHGNEASALANSLLCAMTMVWTIKSLCNWGFNLLFGKVHELQRKLVWRKTIVVPTTYTIGDAESTICNEVCVLTLVRQLSLTVCSLNENKRCIFIVIYLIIFNAFMLVFIKERYLAQLVTSFLYFCGRICPLKLNLITLFNWSHFRHKIWLCLLNCCCHFMLAHLSVTYRAAFFLAVVLLLRQS